MRVLTTPGWMSGTDDAATAMPEDADAEMARRALVDRGAFLDLYNRYVVAVERYAAARVGRSDVDDIVSATFTRALARIDSFRPGRGSFSAWLFTIERNLIADQWRSVSRARGIEGREHSAASERSPEALAVAAEDAHEVRLALAQLTRDQQDALALRYAADLPFADIARVMRKSESAVKMLVQRGLQALRRDLKETANHE